MINKFQKVNFRLWVSVPGDGVDDSLNFGMRWYR